MGLLIPDHLQTVFDPPQEPIGTAQLGSGLRADPAAFSEAEQRLDRASRPEFRMSPARDQLLGLHEEFDIADAAAPELDVMAFDRDRAMTFEFMHAPLHRVDVGDGGIVEIFPPDEGRELAQENLAELFVAGGGPRLDQRRALPVLPEALVIRECGVGRERDLRRARIGPQPQVRAERIALARVLLQQLDEIACDLDEKGRRFAVRLQAGALRVVKHDQIDIAGVIQLGGPELAHGDHDIAVAGRHALFDLSRLFRFSKQKRDGFIQRRFCRLAHRGDDHIDVPHAAKIGEARKQRDPPLEAPEQYAHLFYRPALSDPRRELRARTRHVLLRVAQQTVGEQVRVAQRKRGKIG